MAQVIAHFLAMFLILGPGALAPADPGVLEGVAERRIRYGYGLSDVDPAAYEVLVAVSDCELLGSEGVLVTEGDTYTLLVVDCEARKDKGILAARGLLADVNVAALGHQQGFIVLWVEE